VIPENGVPAIWLILDLYDSIDVAVPLDLLGTFCGVTAGRYPFASASHRFSDSSN